MRKRKGGMRRRKSEGAILLNVPEFDQTVPVAKVDPLFGVALIRCAPCLPD